MFRLCEVQGQSGHIVYLYTHDTGVTRDLKYFIDEQIKSVQSRCNMRDLEQTENMFDAENIALDVLSPRQKYGDRNSGLTENYLHF